MKLTKLQAQTIAKKYNLGKVISFELFHGGLVNYNYKLTTEKGLFVIRILGDKMDDWKKKKFKLEQEVLEHLRKKKFPYKIPIALKDSKGKILGKVGKLSYWVYPFIEGEARVKLNTERLKELARAIAIYYMYIKDFKIKTLKGEFSLDWFLSQYTLLEKKIAKIKIPNKTDLLVKKNFGDFYSLTKELSKIDFLINPIVAHGDIIKSNVLFSGDKLIGIIDFDNLKIAPRAEDISYTLRQHAVDKTGIVRSRYNLMLREYEKRVKLSKKEKEIFIPLMLRGNVIVFWWMYASMKKAQDKKYVMIKELVDIKNVLMREWKK